MLYDHNGRGKAFGESRQQRGQRGGTTGGRSQRHQSIASGEKGSSPTPPRRELTVNSVVHQPADRLELEQEGRRAVTRAFWVDNGCVDCVQGARPHRVEDFGGVAFHGGGDD